MYDEKKSSYFIEKYIDRDRQINRLYYKKTV